MRQDSLRWIALCRKRIEVIDPQILYSVRNKKVCKVNEFEIEAHLHVFQCSTCKAYFQAKDINSVIFETEDPRCIKCDHSRIGEGSTEEKIIYNFIKVCEC